MNASRAVFNYLPSCCVFRLFQCISCLSKYCDHKSSLARLQRKSGREEMAAAYTISSIGLLHRISALLVLGAATGGGLSDKYYVNSCPGVEVVVRNALLPIFITDARSPAAFLRLFFHDCLVQGCDASILLDNGGGITSEMESSKNFGIRNRDSIGLVKSLLELECPGQVSCADIIVLAAREAVAYSGGPQIAVPLGRKDSTIASNGRSDAQLPSANIEVDEALHIFLSNAMSLEESVAILGAHTIGVGHCINIVERLYNSKLKQNIDPEYEALLRLNCPTEVSFTNATIVPGDLTTLLFDNQYYRDVIEGRGLFVVDAGIATDPRTAAIVKQFSEDQGYFFSVFSSAFVKLSSVTGESGAGEIRRQCDRVN